MSYVQYAGGPAPYAPPPTPPPPSAEQRPHHTHALRTAAATSAVGLGILSMIAGIFCEAPILFILGVSVLVGGIVSSSRSFHYSPRASHYTPVFAQPHYAPPSAPPVYIVPSAPSIYPAYPPPPAYPLPPQRVNVGDHQTNQQATYAPTDRIPTGDH